MGNCDIRVPGEMAAGNPVVNRVYPPVAGHYEVRARDVGAPFVAYWNGREWKHPALRYGIKIEQWINQ